MNITDLATIRIPIVGAHFHPPGKVVLAALPSGWPILLLPDPDNEYDGDAIRVLTKLDSDAFPALFEDDEVKAAFDAELHPYGWSMWELTAQADPLWLGFVARSYSKTSKQGPGNAEVLAAFGHAMPLICGLTFDADGAPCVDLSEPREALKNEEESWWERRPFNE